MPQARYQPFDYRQGARPGSRLESGQLHSRWHDGIVPNICIYIYTYGEISGDVTYDIYIYTYLIHGDSLSLGNIP